MPKFMVTARQTFTRSATFEVSAKDKNEAWEKADEFLCDNEDSLNWSSLDSDEPEIQDVERS